LHQKSEYWRRSPAGIQQDRNPDPAGHLEAQHRSGMMVGLIGQLRAGLTTLTMAQLFGI
jgi:hypothetical protein